MGNETDEIIEKMFDSLLQKYQEGLEELMRGSRFIRDSVDLLYYHLQKISLKRGRSYTDSPKQLKNKKATINPKINDDKCFQYALIAALNYQNIKSHPKKISYLKNFIDQYNCKGTNFSPHPSKDWKKNELNNETIVLNIFFVPCIIEKIRLAFQSKHNFKR